MPSLGTGLSLGTISRLPGFDFDASAYIIANNISNSASVDNFDSSANSATFNGSGRLQVTTNNFNINSTDDFSWGGWVFFNNTSTGFPMGFGNNNKFYWNVNTIFWEWGPLNIGNSGYGAKTPNTWYHVFMTSSRSGGSQVHKLFLNGSLINSQTSTCSQTMSNPTFYVGASSSTEYVEGRIDGVCIFKRTISDSDVAWLYNSGKGRRYSEAVTESKNSNVLAWYELDETSGSRADASGNGNTLTLSGSGTSYNTGVIPNGTISVNPQTQINSFVKEIKNLGLWNNILFYPLRSFQNLSSGTTLKSLGGYGAIDATINFGGSKTANGVVLNGNLFQTITGNLTSSNGNVSRSAFVVTTNYISGQMLGPGWGTITSTRFSLRRDSVTSSQLDSYDGITNDSFGISNNNLMPIFYLASYNSSATNLFTYANGSVVTSATLTRNISSQTGFKFNGWGNGGDSVGYGTFVVGGVLDTSVTQAQANTIYNAYKATLGQGIGLP